MKTGHLFRLLTAIACLLLSFNVWAQDIPPVTLHVETAGTLPSLINADRKIQITNLTLTGNLNGTDIKFIQEMAGRTVSGEQTNGKLAVLHLAGANIVSGGDYYYKSTSYRTSNNVISNYMFYNCSNLTSVTIPNSVMGIGYYAFSGCTGLASVTIGNSVTEIGYMAFEGCIGLTSVTIPNSVTKIGTWVFSGCTSLASVTIGNNVTAIGGDAFSGCTGLTSVTIGNSVTEIGDRAFEGCTGLTGITIPNSVTSLSGFSGCTGLTDITIPNSVTEIGDRAFGGCTGLTGITIPNSVTSLSGFSGCAGLTSITIPNSVTSLSGFDGTGLTDITIPNSVTSIGWAAFGRCTGLTSITIPDSVTEIEMHAFFGCTGLTSATIGNSVTEIGRGAFEDCTNLMEIYSKNPTPPILGSYGFQINKTTCILYVPTGSRDAYWSAWGFDNVIENSDLNPPDVLTVSPASLSYTASGGSKSFSVSSNTGWTVVSSESWATVSPASGANDGTVTVTASANPAASQRTATITVSGGGITQIVDLIQTAPSYTLNVGPASLSYAVNGGSQSFSIYSNTNWTVSSSESWATVSSASGANNGTITVATSANPTARQRTATITVSGGEITRTVSIIQQSGITTLTLHVETAGTLPALIAESEKYQITDLTLTGNLNGTDILYIREMAGAGSSMYSATDGKLTVLNLAGANIVSGGDYYYSHSYSYYYTKNDTISAFMFYDCYRLTSITMPDNVTSIGTSAFDNCKRITNIIIPNSVTSIGKEAFSDCEKLTGITIPDNVTSIGENAFYGCEGLTSVTIGNSVISIGGSAFSNCWRLINVTIPNSVTSIGRNAFSECTELKSITIGNSVASIGGSAFSDCIRLIEIHSNNPTPPGTNVTCFENVDTETCKLYVPKGSYNAYWHAPGWSRFATIIEEDTPAPASTLIVSPASLSFTAGGGSQSIAVSSNTGWTVASSESWASVSPASSANNGTVTVTTSANASTGQRTATLTVSGGGITRTVNLTQNGTTAPSYTLNVSPASLSFAASGGSQSFAVSSNTNWTVSSSESWATVTPASGTNSGTVTVIAATHTGNSPRTGILTLSGGGLTQTVAVTQASTQQVIVNPSTPGGNQGTIDISLQIPVDENFTATFTVSLPAGFQLNRAATALVAELLSSFELEIIPIGANKWRFAIYPKLSTLSADGTEYRQLVQIAYTMNESVVKGEYEVKLNDIDLTLNDGQVIHQDEVRAPVTVTTSVGNAAVEAGDVRYAGGILTVNTPAAEQITVYSVSGSVMYQAQKAAGEATFDLRSLPKGVFIARGSSGWTKKVVISD